MLNTIKKYLFSENKTTRTISQVISWIVSFVVYDLLLDWKWGVVIIVGLFFHELGHFLTAKKLQIKTGGMISIPMLGGLTLLDHPTSYAKKYLIAMGGATLGFATAGICWIIYLFTHQHIIGVVAVIWAIINGFQMLPLAGLDGDLAVESILYSYNEKVGFWAMIGLFVVIVPLIWLVSPICSIVLLLMGLLKILKSFSIRKIKNEFTNKMELNIVGKIFTLYKMEGLEIVAAGIGYLVLIGLLVGIIWWAKLGGVF